MINETKELEETFLSVLLTNSDYFQKVLIDESYFNYPETRKIFQLLKKQYADYKTIDLRGLIENYPSFFQENNKITIEYLVDIIQLGTPSHFEYYQESLFNIHTRKQLLLEIEKFKNNHISQEELLESIHEIEQKSLKNNSVNLTGEQIYNLISQQKKRITFRYPKLTQSANIQEHDLIIIAARPGIGKTGFALNILESLSNDYKCLYFNMEMTEQQIYRRLVGINSNIPIIFHDNSASGYQINKLKESSNSISKKKINILTGGQTIRTIRSKIIKESVDEHLIVFIDYIGLIRDTEKNRSSYERVTEITKELRQISLDYNCTIFVLAQINRNSEKEKNKFPKISDLKESGELEQSATTVLMLHNENTYKPVEYRTEEIKLIIGKNRNGETGIINFDYNQKTQRFDEEKNY